MYHLQKHGKWKLHSKRVGNVKTTLETSGEIQNYTRKEWRRWCLDCYSSSRNVHLFWKKCWYLQWLTVMFVFSTRFECSFTSSPLVSSVVFQVLAHFRGEGHQAGCFGRGQGPCRGCLDGKISKCTTNFNQELPRTVKTHSKRVGKMWEYTRFECGRSALKILTR